MNRERCKELLPIIQAWAEGKEVQAKGQFTNYMWAICDIKELADFDDMGLTFRIKPEEKTGWINIYDTNCMSPVYETKEKANFVNSQPEVMTRLACIPITYTEGEGL